MSTVEDKIINATVSCIEKYGIKKTTIRQIGKEAGVNSASINYYFRSKDILMQHVMKVYCITHLILRILKVQRIFTG